MSITLSLATLRVGLENLEGDLYLYGIGELTAEQALASISDTTSDLWSIVGRDPIATEQMKETDR